MNEKEIRERERMAIIEMIDGLNKSNMFLDAKTVDVICKAISTRNDADNMFVGKSLVELPEI